MLRLFARAGFEVVVPTVGRPSLHTALAPLLGRVGVVVVDEFGRPRSWPSITELATKPEVSDYLDTSFGENALSSE